MSTITIEQEQQIRDFLVEHPVLSVGVGDEKSACSIAAINLALRGELTDEVPDCMSPVIGRWIITVQDEMPADIRNSDAWRDLLPLAAGTGRDHEQERLGIVLDWMWGTVLTHIQPLADDLGFGDAWRTMTTERTETAAAAAKAEAAAAAEAAKAAKAAAAAARAAKAAAAEAAEAAAAAWAAARAAEEAAEEAAWTAFDPVELLDRLIRVSAEKRGETDDTAHA